MFSSMTLRVRLYAAFAILAALLACIAGIGLSRMGAIRDNLNTITERYIAQMNEAADMRGAAMLTSIQIRNVLLMTEDSKLQRDLTQLHEAMSQFDKARDSLDRRLSTSADTPRAQAALMDVIKADWTALGIQLQRVFLAGDGEKVRGSRQSILRGQRDGGAGRYPSIQTLRDDGSGAPTQRRGSGQGACYLWRGPDPAARAVGRGAGHCRARGVFRHPRYIWEPRRRAGSGCGDAERACGRQFAYQHSGAGR